jgi:hypothetical protein
MVAEEKGHYRAKEAEIGDREPSIQESMFVTDLLEEGIHSLSS